MADWIDVNDRLPEPCVDVLILTYGQEKEQVVGWRDFGSHWLMELGHNYDEPSGGADRYPAPQATVFEVINVTHWMPLPDPPKAKP